MAITRTNQFINVSRIFKGYFTLYDDPEATTVDDGVVFNRIAELQHGIEQSNAATYGTFGDKKVATIGYDGDCSVRVAETADLYPTVNAVATPTFNVSHFLNKLTKLELVPARFSGIEETDAASAQYVVTTYTGFAIGSNVERNNTLGIYERVFNFDIIKIQSSVRANTVEDIVTPAP